MAIDPDACLAEIRAIISQVSWGMEHEGVMMVPARTVERLIMLQHSLDEWLMKGGFLPADWSKLNEKNPRLTDIEPG